MAGLEGLDSASPTGSEFIREGDNAIRELKAALLAFAGLAHHLDGSHKIGVGALSSRPAAGKVGNLWVLTVSGVAVELQYDTGTAWSNLTSNQTIVDYVTSLTTHSTATTLSHPDSSVTMAKIAAGALAKKHFDGSTEATSVASLVDGTSADSLHTHAALVALYNTIPAGLEEASITGDFVVHAVKLLSVGTDLLAASDSVASSMSGTYVRLKEFRLGDLTKAGSSLRIKFSLWKELGVGETIYSEDFPNLNPGDFIQLWAHRNTGDGKNYARVYINNIAVGTERSKIVTDINTVFVSKFQLYHTKNINKFTYATLE